MEINAGVSNAHAILNAEQTNTCTKAFELGVTYKLQCKLFCYIVVSTKG